MDLFENEVFFRRLHLVWFGSEPIAPISAELRLRLLSFLGLMTPEEQSLLMKDFPEVFADQYFKMHAEQATILLARLNEIQTRALKKLRSRPRPETPSDDSDPGQP